MKLQRDAHILLIFLLAAVIFLLISQRFKYKNNLVNAIHKKNSHTALTISNGKTKENPNYEKFITIVNPIRSREQWNNKLTESLERQLFSITSRNLNATWLIQYDNLDDEEIISLLKSQSSTQEVGALLEVSRKWASDARVKYKIDEGDYYRPDKVFLSGYSQKERKKLISTYFKKFNEVFYYSPHVVGAWYIDAYSNLLLTKLNVTAALTLSDQFDTDAASIWGKYLSVPYYPATLNPLEPASSLTSKVPIVTIQWAQRDPVASYGKEIKHSRQSLQANDYISNGFTTDYFLNLLENYLSNTINDFMQITIGLEAAQEADRFASEFDKQLDVIGNLQKSSNVQVLTLSGFAFWYKNKYPDLSPNHVLLKGDNIWYMSPKFRLALFKEDNHFILKDLRYYQNHPFNDYFLKDTDTYLLKNTSATIDQVKYSNQIDLGPSKKYEINSNFDQFSIKLDNSLIEVDLSGLKKDGKYLVKNKSYEIDKNRFRIQNLQENMVELLNTLRFSSINGEIFFGFVPGDDLYGFKGILPGKYSFDYQILSRFKSPADLLR